MTTAHAQTQEFTEGVHFTALNTPLERTTSKNEVMEFFWYGCGHCYAFEPVLESWRHENSYINFIRNPVTWDRTKTHHAQLYYVAQALGVTDTVHNKIFDEIHQHNNYLLSEADAKNFFIEHGVNADDFDKAYNSFSINTQLRRADSMQRANAISSVPSIIVAGKYLVKVNDEVQNHNQVLEVVEFLLSLEES